MNTNLRDWVQPDAFDQLVLGRMQSNDAFDEVGAVLSAAGPGLVAHQNVEAFLENITHLLSFGLFLDRFPLKARLNFLERLRGFYQSASDSKLESPALVGMESVAYDRPVRWRRGPK
jgi:hypothetical protein